MRQGKQEGSRTRLARHFAQQEGQLHPSLPHHDTSTCPSKQVGIQEGQACYAPLGTPMTSPPPSGALAVPGRGTAGLGSLSPRTSVFADCLCRHSLMISPKSLQASERNRVVSGSVS